MNQQMTDGIHFLKKKVKHLPTGPGVYRMYNEADDLLYVGKALNLKNRVTNYTQEAGLTRRIRQMVYHTTKLEIVETNSETEALLLEANLIKELQPRYNIRLKDDSSYPGIALSPYKDGLPPRLRIHRGKKPKEGWYFGPYPAASHVRDLADMVERIFQLRTCTDGFYKNRKRPCIKYDIKRCSGPCVGKVTDEAYKAQVKEAVMFLDGRSADVQKNITQNMLKAAEAENFELAARERDRLAVLAKMTTSQNVVASGLRDADIMAVLQHGGETVVQIFSYRNSHHIGNMRLFPDRVDDMPLPEVLASFMSVYYADKPIPAEIVSNVLPEGAEVLSEALSEQRGSKVTITSPKRGQKAEIVDQALKNAMAELTRKQAESKKQKAVMAEFAELLGIDGSIQRIECFDVSNIQGRQAVASMVVAGEEGMLKNQYRKFAVKTKDSPDDYHMMREILTRRYKRLLKEDPAFENWPQVVMVDGGKGHLNVLIQVFKDLGIDVPQSKVALCAIAKGEFRDKGLERIFVPGNPEPLPVEYNSPLIFMLQRIRDESHRTAIGYHRQKRAKALTHSVLEDIPGVGAKRKKALLHHFGSAAGVKKASVKDLMNVDGVSEAMAQEIYNFFRL